MKSEVKGDTFALVSLRSMTVICNSDYLEKLNSASAFVIVRSLKVIDEEKTAMYKSKKFAIAIVAQYKDLTKNKNEFVLSKQLLKSGTSIGTNLAESECAISGKDFLNKLYIALKECNETLYWLELLFETEYLEKENHDLLRSQCLEIKRILSASTKTLTEKQKED